MVTVNVAQFHHLLLVEQVTSRALCKDYSHTMILLKARGLVLTVCALSTRLHNDIFKPTRQ